MIKNPTPHGFAVRFSVLTALIFALVSIAVHFIIDLDWFLLAWFVALISGIIAYFVLRGLLGTFLYRKIKPIYKMIKKTKVSSENRGNLDLNTDVLSDVEEEVAQWVARQRKEIESMKAMEEYRRTFIGNVSHELKTPIFSIQGFIETLADGQLEEERRSFYFHRTKKNIERLITIVEDLDTISKIESGAFTLELTEFSIVELIQEVFLDLKVISDSKDITLEMKEDFPLDIRVVADRESISQVLNNLIVNSIKYGREGGYTRVGIYDVDKDILVEIADDGPGIEQHHLNHLFDRFYRVDKSRARAEGGSGLGLSIVKHIIEAHGQTINVRSTIGKGSTFGFTLRRVG